MSYLEQKRYAHCDLAGRFYETKILNFLRSIFLARNILVGEVDVVKIADFGLAKILQGGRLMVDRGLFIL
jgi:serine/threonine protein kinase